MILHFHGFPRVELVKFLRSVVPFWIQDWLILKTFLDMGQLEEYLAFSERLGISRIDS